MGGCPLKEQNGSLLLIYVLLIHMPSIMALKEGKGHESNESNGLSLTRRGKTQGVTSVNTNLEST